jgi:hypothetical protein
MRPGGGPEALAAVNINANTRRDLARVGELRRLPLFMIHSHLGAGWACDA